MQIGARRPKPDLPLYKGKDMEEYRDFIQRCLNFFDITDEYFMDNAHIALAASRFHKGSVQKWGFLLAVQRSVTWKVFLFFFYTELDRCA
jgi:hypothetical protein